MQRYGRKRSYADSWVECNDHMMNTAECQRKGLGTGKDRRILGTFGTENVLTLDWENGLNDSLSPIILMKSLLKD